MKRVVLLMSMTCGLAATVVAGNAFYWRGGNNWGSWSDASKWDTIVCYGGNISTYVRRLGFIDLGGEDRYIAGFDFGTGSEEWRRYCLDLTNGTFIVGTHPYVTSSHNIACEFTLRKDATVKFVGAANPTLGRSGQPEIWTINNGARMEFNAACQLYAFQVDVKAGGSLSFAASTFGLAPSVARNYNYFKSAGDLHLPSGLIWNDTCGSTVGNNRDFTVNINGGRLFLGGNVTKTYTSTGTYAQPLTFNFSTSTLVVTNDVAFIPVSTSPGESVVANVAADKTLTVDVQEDSSLDATIFAYGSGSSVVKQGPGTMTFGSLPPSLAVQAGTAAFAETLDGTSSISLSPGASIRFCRTGNVIGTAPANYAAASFSLETANFTEPCVVLTSSDADFLAHVAAQIAATVPEGLAAQVADGRLSLVTSSGDIFTSSGELDLGDPSGWNSASVPSGNDIVVSGPDTVALVTGTTPAFGSITLENGATLKVTGANIDLPPVSLSYPSKLFVAGGATAYITNGLAGGGDASGLPVFEIATNATVTAARNTKFKNMDFRLYGKIEVPQTGSDGLYFGYADAGETAYFAMTSVGGKVLIPLNSGLGNAWKNFASPASGGRVVVRGPIVLKDTEFLNTFIRASDNKSVSIYNGLWFGVNNPSDEPFEVIIDNTAAPIDKYAAIRGGATVRCINGGRLYRTASHPGIATKGEIKEAGRAVVEGKGCGISYPHAGLQDSIQHSPFTVSPEADGFESIVLGDWATVALHESGGNGKAVLAVSNGIWQVGTLPQVPNELSQYLPSGDPRDWMTDVLAGLKAVRIAEGTEFRLESAEVLGGTAWNRDVKLANVPLTGAGDLVMTNGTPGYTFRATIVSANNTATGVAKAVCGTGGDATTLLFSDGANWAGTVVAGNVALTNVADGAAAVTVNFGSLRLDGDFPVRVWATTNDMVNISSQLLAGDGAFAPVAMPGRAAFMPGESFKLGTYPANTAFPSKVGNWKITASTTGDPALMALTLTYMPPGTVMLFR